VGPLQFEVVQYRLQSEYNAESRLENASFRVIRWLRRKDGTPWSDQAVALPSETVLARDEEDRPVVLLSSQWQEKSLADRNPGMEISSEPFALQAVAV
jgi:peptide chain release factor 3